MVDRIKRFLRGERFIYPIILLGALVLAEMDVVPWASPLPWLGYDPVIPTPVPPVHWELYAVLASALSLSVYYLRQITHPERYGDAFRRCNLLMLVSFVGLIATFLTVPQGPNATHLVIAVLTIVALVVTDVMTAVAYKKTLDTGVQICRLKEDHEQLKVIISWIDIPALVGVGSVTCYAFLHADQQWLGDFSTGAIAFQFAAFSTTYVVASWRPRRTEKAKK